MVGVGNDDANKWRHDRRRLQILKLSRLSCMNHGRGVIELSRRWIVIEGGASAGGGGASKLSVLYLMLEVSQ